MTTVQTPPQAPPARRAGAVIVELRDSGGPITLGLGEGAYTGFVSWLESSSPRF